MIQLKYNRELYHKIALIKAAYNFTDRAYLHLDADEDFYYVSIYSKNECEDICAQEFENEILAQSVRHEIYLQTKTIRELMLARAVATSVVTSDIETKTYIETDKQFDEGEILKDWFSVDE